MSTQENELARLNVENRELRADKDRLDWLSGACSEGRVPGRCFIGDDIGWSIRNIYGILLGQGLTLRDAIDAARGAK